MAQQQPFTATVKSVEAMQQRPFAAALKALGQVQQAPLASFAASQREQHNKMLDALVTQLEDAGRDYQARTFTPPKNLELEVAAETRDLIAGLLEVIQRQADAETAEAEAAAIQAVEAQRTRRWAAASFLLAAFGVVVGLLH